MHIPDGFLDAKTLVVTAVGSVGTISYCISKTKEVLQEKYLPSLGVMSAFIFAAQMVNFPVIGGTSGHLLGATLATILFGPFNAIIIVSSVLVVQCLLFQDGGITALGANIFNMAVIAVIISHICYQIFKKIINNKNLLIFITSWLAILASSVGVSVELAMSETIPLQIVLPVMLGWHVLIGIGEGIITVLVVNFLKERKILCCIES